MPALSWTRAAVLVLAVGSACASASSLTVEVEGDGTGSDQAVVWLETLGDVSVSEVAKPESVPRMDQRDRAFVPGVLPVSVGQSVRFQNSDSVRHHVYSFSEAKRFELPLFRAGESHAVRFDQPGVVVLGCNIHDHMVGYVVVADSRWVARVGNQGRASFDLPAGNYRLRVWHPRLKSPGNPTERRLELGEGDQNERVTLELEPPPRRREFSREALQGG